MFSVLKYKDGVLSLRDEWRVYFEIDLSGRVEVRNLWSVENLVLARLEAGKFLVDFLRRRKVKEVQVGEKNLWNVFHTHRKYDIVITYEDCTVYIDWDEKKYLVVLVMHEDFRMLFEPDLFKFKLINQKEHCEIVDESYMTTDYLERLVSGFSGGMLDIDAECEFELEDESLVINVNGRRLIEVDENECAILNHFIYYNVGRVRNEDALYEFMWRLYLKNADNLSYEMDGSNHILKAGNFRIRYDSVREAIDFIYIYNGAGFGFEIELNYLLGHSVVEVLFRNGVRFECLFKTGMNMFRRLIKADGRIEKYIKGLIF